MDQCPGDRATLHETAGEGPDRIVLAVRQSHSLENLLDTLARFGEVEHAGVEQQVLGGSQCAVQKALV